MIASKRGRNPPRLISASAIVSNRIFTLEDTWSNLVDVFAADRYRPTRARPSGRAQSGAALEAVARSPRSRAIASTIRERPAVHHHDRARLVCAEIGIVVRNDTAAPF